MKIPSKIYTFLIFLFLYAPIIVMIIFSFNSSNSTGLLAGFSFKWYTVLLENKSIMQALSNTLVLAVSSAIMATVIGTAAAVGIDKWKKNWLKSSVMGVTNIPMMNQMS